MSISKRERILHRRIRKLRAELTWRKEDVRAWRSSYSDHVIAVPWCQCCASKVATDHECSCGVSA